MLLAVEQQIGAAGRGRAASSLTTQRRVEAVDPVVPRLLSKAYWCVGGAGEGRGPLRLLPTQG